MRFALFMVVPTARGLSRKWLRYCDGAQDLAWIDTFDKAKQMNLEEAVATYRLIDSPNRTMGLVPIE